MILFKQLPNNIFLSQVCTKQPHLFIQPARAVWLAVMSTKSARGKETVRRCSILLELWSSGRVQQPENAVDPIFDINFPVEGVSLKSKLATTFKQMAFKTCSKFLFRCSFLIIISAICFQKQLDNYSRKTKIMIYQCKPSISIVYSKFYSKSTFEDDQSVQMERCSSLNRFHVPSVGDSRADRCRIAWFRLSVLSAYLVPPQQGNSN